MDNAALAQSFMMQVMYKSNFQIIDYLKFCDLVGYEQPIKSNKEQARKIFYKIFLKDLNANMNYLQMAFRN